MTSQAIPRGHHPGPQRGEVLDTELMIQQFAAATISSAALIDCLWILSSPGTTALG
jgi:hypothetical protein